MSKSLDIEICRSRVWEAICDALEPYTNEYGIDDLPEAEQEALSNAVETVTECISKIIA